MAKKLTMTICLIIFAAGCNSDGEKRTKQIISSLKMLYSTDNSYELHSQTPQHKQDMKEFEDAIKRSLNDK